MRARAWLLVLAICGCNPITQPPGSAAPVNVCAGTSGLTCGGYPSDAGVRCESTGAAAACLAHAINPFVLVVTVPALAPLSAGTTYAISSEQLFSGATYDACTTPPAGEPPQDACFRIGAVQEAGGAYVIDEVQAREAGRYLGDTDNGLVTLPVAVTFWPQWTPPDTATSTGVSTDARLLNLPLPPVFANVGTNVAMAYVPWLPGLDGAARRVSGIGICFRVDCRPPAVDGWPPSLEQPRGVRRRGRGDRAVRRRLPGRQLPGRDELTPSSSDGTNLAFVIGWSSRTRLITIEQWPGSQTPGASLPPLTVEHADGKPFIGGWTVYLRIRPRSGRSRRARRSPARCLPPR